MDVLQTVFWSLGSSRNALADRLDCSKSKANALAAGLIEQGLLEETGLQASSGGRRPETLRLASGLGVIVGVDLGATSLDVAVVRPGLGVLGRPPEEADVGAGPGGGLARGGRARHGEGAGGRGGRGVVRARGRDVRRDLLAGWGASEKRVIGGGRGVPGPGAFAGARRVAPPLMPEWDGFSIRDYLGE